MTGIRSSQHHESPELRQRNIIDICERPRCNTDQRSGGNEQRLGGGLQVFIVRFVHHNECSHATGSHLQFRILACELQFDVKSVL